MTSPELERLAERAFLERETASTAELRALVSSGRRVLADAPNRSLALESRFTLAYDAAHAFALAALRSAGYRSASRYLVFQCLEHTASIPAAARQQLVKAHERRNKGLYEGVFEISERFVEETIDAARVVLAALPADLDRR
jgi:hypothetical protein